VCSDQVLQIEAVERRYVSGNQRIGVLDRLNLNLEQGERVAIMGASGSGKTTLLHLAAGMDRPDAGRVILAGRDLGRLGEPELTRLRARHTGLIFQDFNLIDSLTVSENIELPRWLNRLTPDPDQLSWLCQALDIKPLLERLPDQLSGGERQRVAIARALIHQPALLLADEPTGSLDQNTASRVLELFDQVLRETGRTLLMVTHNEEAAALCDRVLFLRNGQLQAA
jgi:ABC-type lipoprotein export system ATPase subunit